PVAYSFSGNRFLHFVDCTYVSGVKLADLGELLSLNKLDMLKAFLNAAIVIGERGVIFQDSALYLEVVDTASERISKCFEDKQGKRLAVVVLTLNAVAIASRLLIANLGGLIGMGEGVGEESEQVGGDYVVERGRGVA